MRVNSHTACWSKATNYFSQNSSHEDDCCCHTAHLPTLRLRLWDLSFRKNDYGDTFPSICRLLQWKCRQQSTNTHISTLLIAFIFFRSLFWRLCGDRSMSASKYHGSDIKSIIFGRRIFVVVVHLFCVRQAFHQPSLDLCQLLIISSCKLQHERTKKSQFSWSRDETEDIPSQPKLLSFPFMDENENILLWSISISAPVSPQFSSEQKEQSCRVAECHNLLAFPSFQKL